MNFKTPYIGFCFALFVLSACSGSLKEADKVNNNNNMAKTTPHHHEGNACTLALTHAHAGDVEGHNHNHTCEHTKEYVSNGHTHPATKTRKRSRHVHPNGAISHTHW